MSGDSSRDPGGVRVGVLLAGGEARRMGRDKRRLRLGDATLLERNLAFLHGLFPVVGLSLRSASQAPERLPAGVEVVPDLVPGSPLGGLASILARYREPVFALAADLAFPDREAVARVVAAFDDVDVALPVAEDHLEPLHAVYGPGCLPHIERLLAAGAHSILDLFPLVRVAEIPFATSAPFFNVNTPADWDEARRMAGAGRAGGGPAVLGVVGRPRSGKTTLIERPIPAILPDARVAQVGFPDDATFRNIDTMDDDRNAQRETAGCGAPAYRTGSQPALVAIVGKSDSGKTTLIEKVVPELVKLGLRVGTVKHDAHSFEIDHPGKDSWRHGQAGAHAYVIASPERLAFITRLEGEMPLADIVRRFFIGFDLVVAEGYKRTAPHRVELFRLGAGHTEPLCAPGEAIALVTDADLEHEHRFGLEDGAGLARFLAVRLDALREY